MSKPLTQFVEGDLSYLDLLTHDEPERRALLGKYSSDQLTPSNARRSGGRFMRSFHGSQAVRIDHEPAAEVGRVTPCAPLLVAPGPGARGATRPTVRFMGRERVLI